MLIILSNSPDGSRCQPTPARSCCETGSPAPPRAIRTSRGSCRPTTDARSATASCATLTRRIATLLRERGIGRNDRVALLANNSIEHLICYFGVMAYGATICTVHVEMNRNQLDNIFARLQPEARALPGRACSSTISSPRCRRRACGSATGMRPRPDTFFGEARALRAVGRTHRRRAGRRRRDPVHLRHQREAEGRGAELSRAPLQHRSDRRRLRHHGRRPRSTISARSTGPRRSSSARWCRSTAARRW